MKKINRILILLVMMLGFTNPQTLPTHASIYVRHQTRNLRTPHQNLISSPANAMNNDWVIECIDCPKLFGYLTDRSLRLDSNGYPHIAYGEDHLYYAWYDGKSWYYETVDEAPRTGIKASLVLDDSGYPYISYCDKTAAVKYAHKDSNGWQINTIHTGEETFALSSIDLDKVGSPHISYVVGTGGFYGNDSQLHHAYLDSQGWQHEILDSGLANTYNISIKVDVDGNIHIIYDDTGSLIYAFQDGNGWEYKTVDSQGYNPSMVLDNDGYPQIAYFNMNSAELWETEELRYAFQDDSGWYSETVEINKMVEADWGVSLALGSDNQPIMSICEGFDRDLNLIFVYRESGTWKTQIVDTEARYSSLDIDSQGRPHISYYHEFDPAELKYATLGTFGWQKQTVDSEGLIMGSAPMALDDLGKPHINYSKSSRESSGGMYAYLSETGWIIQDGNPYGSLILDSSNKPYIFNGRTLFYLHESSWISDTVDCLEESSYEQQSSLALDRQGNPHVVVTTEVCGRYTCDFGVLEYAHRQAGSWICESVGSDSGEGPSLAIDNNNLPYISFNAGIYLMLAIRDDSGWNIQFVDDGLNGNTSLALDGDGFAHISYQGDLNLKYAHQTSNGWELQTVDSGGEVGVYNSIALNGDGKQHISYYKYTGYHQSELKYAVQEQDQWITTTVDPLTGGPNSIALDQLGNPHISYVDEINEDLKYAYIPPPMHAVITIPQQSWGYAYPGEWITHTLQIANSGLMTDTYSLSLDQSLWLVELPAETGTLLPYQSEKVAIQVTIPTTATLGSSDTAALTLTSQSDPSINASATLTTYAAITTYLPLVSR